MINNELKARGILTWFDEEQMKGNIVTAMCNGIDKARCILVFVTSHYMTKVGG